MGWYEKVKKRREKRETDQRDKDNRERIARQELFRRRRKEEMIRFMRQQQTLKRWEEKISGTEAS